VDEEVIVAVVLVVMMVVWTVYVPSMVQGQGIRIAGNSWVVPERARDASTIG
jgi:predicted membrane protein